MDCPNCEEKRAQRERVTMLEADAEGTYDVKDSCNDDTNRTQNESPTAVDEASTEAMAGPGSQIADNAAVVDVVQQVGYTRSNGYREASLHAEETGKADADKATEAEDAGREDWKDRADESDIKPLVNNIDTAVDTPEQKPEARLMDLSSNVRQIQQREGESKARTGPSNDRAMIDDNDLGISEDNHLQHKSDNDTNGSTESRQEALERLISMVHGATHEPRKPSKVSAALSEEESTDFSRAFNRRGSEGNQPTALKPNRSNVVKADPPEVLPVVLDQSRTQKDNPHTAEDDGDGDGGAQNATSAPPTNHDDDESMDGDWDLVDDDDVPPQDELPASQELAVKRKGWRLPWKR